MRFFHQKKELNHYKMMMENSREILVFFDAYGSITGYNRQAATLLGYGDELHRLPIYYVFKNAFLYQNGKLKIDTIYRDNTAEAIAYRKNQSCFPVELRISVLESSRSFTGLCSAINLTDKKASARELADLRTEVESNHQLNLEVVANMTHELRTPVNGIAGFSNDLLNSELSTEQEEAVSIIKQSCSNLDKIINNLLDYARLSGNKPELEVKEFNFRKAICQIVDRNKARVSEKGLKLMVDISADIPENVIGDEPKLAQILDNLLSNAAKFTFAGHIGLQITKISGNREDIELFFMLFDTGIGISSKDKDKLFQGFSRADASITSRAEGTGLGLCITKKLVEAMNGSISFDSEINKGSVFSFTIHLRVPSFNDKSALPDPDRSEEIREVVDPDADTDDKAAISELEYVRLKLREVSTNTVSGAVGEIADKGEKKDMVSLLEKLDICIGMENWETAEDITLKIKKLIPEWTPEVSKAVLRLLFAIRRENHEEALQLTTLLKVGMNKEE